AGGSSRALRPPWCRTQLSPRALPLRGVFVPAGVPMTTAVRESLVEFEVESGAQPRRARRLRPAYGFDDVAIVPDVETLHPDDVDLSWSVSKHRFAIPFIASAMDGVVDVSFAVALGKLGGLAVLNLEGLQTRYAQPAVPLAEIAAAPRESAT